MSDSDYKFDEEALRKKIREELEKEHRQRQENLPDSSEDAETVEEKRSDVLEHYLKESIEEEVYSKHPEFIRCENHLNEVRWLTPLELEEDYEFYPTPESRLEKLKKRLFKSPKSIADSPEIRDVLERYRQDLEKDARKRIEKYRGFMAENASNSKKHERSEIESRLFEEEQDRFYGSLKGYKKYKNHAGETRWMTREEFENQDEFIQEVLSRKQIWTRRTGWAVLTLAGLGIIWFLFTIFQATELPGYLIVEMEEAEAHLYIDQSPAFGFAPNKAYPITAGKHEIMVLRAGFASDPKSQTITFAADDTVYFPVSFIPQKSSESGVVRIESSREEAGIFVNGDFRGSLGNNPYLTLPAGNHTVSLKMEGYITDPRQQFISLTSGDTLSLKFRMIAGSAQNGKSTFGTTSFGLIEVSSNIKDAEIFLDGRDTGHKTDYVLQKISLGQHIISVKKEGYIAYPEEKTAKLTKNEKTARVHFNLTSTTRPVTIQTVPERGTIFIDGKSVGTGSFSGSLPLGEHRVSFGDIESYRTPGSRMITVSETGENQFVFYYITDLQVQFEAGGASAEEYSGSASSGYIMEAIDFKTSSQVGPDIRRIERVKTDVWYLNYAYQYRNPPGSDAVAFRFRLPETLEITKTINLKLWIYRTDDNYPLTIKGNPVYKIIINKGIVRESMAPKYDIEQISEERYEQIAVNDFLKTGNNVIIISTARDASAAVALWKISLE